ncbi:hypothetical protein LTR95_005293 [Oleoguttula sp. CCFEE 5521]
MDVPASAIEGRFFNCIELSDIKIKFGSKEIFAHRYVLCLNSEYFRKLLMAGFAETEKKEITLIGDDEGAVVAMLRYLYGLPYLPANEAEVSLLPHAQVYVVAEKYGLPDLQAAIFERVNVGGVSPWGIGWSSFNSDLGDSLRVVFTQTPATDNLLRPALANLCAVRLHSWSSGETSVVFRSLLMDAPDLAIDVLSKMGQSLGGTIKVFTCPFCQCQRVGGTLVDSSDKELRTCELSDTDNTYALADERNWALYQARSDVECGVPESAQYGSSD